MAPIDFSGYFYTGLGGRRLGCVLLILHTPTAMIFSFRKSSGNILFNIVKACGKWEYHSGGHYHRKNWIEELGRQIDSRQWLP
jgi:hypothetical protein